MINFELAEIRYFHFLNGAILWFEVKIDGLYICSIGWALIKFILYFHSFIDESD